MDIDDFEDEDGAQRCPYCASSNDCEHLLLLVDRTFRTAEGGALMRVFNEHWSHLCEKGGDDFDEHQPFEDLLEEVDSSSDYSADFDFEGGPGRSSAYSIYYVKSASRADAVLTHFTSGGEK